MTYELGDIRFPMLWCHLDAVNNPLKGRIRIGGDLGDVVASAVSRYDDGVTLHDAALVTSRKDALCPAAQVEVAQDIVYASYESIGADTFAPTTR